ncbi:MAG: helix-turn-helix domain-containing protein [Gemmatimonadetes bacterium]|nr:helix-turn-helix domain-containing protein [Gemmatimonadota bacterium]MBI3567546.1 helix-turn-helix domain-containing protein [Gemmatimonadota bacterium]
MNASAVPNGDGPTPVVLATTSRDRARDLLKRAFPRRRTALAFCRGATELGESLRRELVDAVVVDIGHVTDDTWKAVALARDFPSIPFFALGPSRVADGPAMGRCAAAEFADLLAEGMDDAFLRELVLSRAFTTRFAEALGTAPAALALTHPLQQAAWGAIVRFGGRTVRTEMLAAQLGVTREHLSRSFAASGAPNLKRIIDLVRLIAAAELSKNPGYDVSDVAQVLDFASPSHLGSTALRVVGARTASLARLRTVDLIDRFRQGRGRSRRRATG